MPKYVHRLPRRSRLNLTVNTLCSVGELIILMVMKINSDISKNGFVRHVVDMLP